MTNSRTNPKVDEFLSKAKKWKEEFEKLRTIILDCELTEDFKWMHPCYTYHNKNIVLIHGFKEYCALLFHKGVLLQDTDGILIQQTENVQAARQIRFTNVQEINELENILKAYIHEAIEVEKAGLPTPPTPSTATVLFFSVSRPSFPIANSLRENWCNKNLTPHSYSGFIYKMADP